MSNMDTWAENAEFLRMLSYDGLKQILTWPVFDLTLNFDLWMSSLYFILGVDGFHKDAINKWNNGHPWGHNDHRNVKRRRDLPFVDHVSVPPCICAILANHSPHNYHFLVNGLDLLITILPCVHSLGVLVWVHGEGRAEIENQRAEVI